MTSADRCEILVLAGTNGAGRSSVIGAALRDRRSDYYDPDEVMGGCLERWPDMPPERANALAWRLGRSLLHRAISRRERFVFETTLGGNSITGLLLKAANVGIPVRIICVGLSSADLHVERVADRVRHGGHDIPEERIRGRYDSSRRNLIRLIPHLAELKVFDNSTEADPKTGRRPAPDVIIHLQRGTVVEACAMADVPAWARAIVMAVLEVAG